MNKKERARQIIVYAIYIISVCCLQVSFSGNFRLLGRSCDLMLVFVALAGYLFGTRDGLVVGAIVGLLRDYFSGTVVPGVNLEPIVLFGVGMLAFFYIGLLASVLFRKRFRRKYMLGILQVALISILYYSLCHVISFVCLSVSGNLNTYHSFRYIVFSSVCPQVMINVIGSIPMLFLLRFVGPYRKGVRSSLIDGYSVEDRKWQSV
ncbi:MAG: hypothetical protein KBT07_04960 [Clostridiales bacterium]|nr:hypothetical protein [Candidatus Scatonaster coprocaballi]